MSAIIEIPKAYRYPDGTIAHQVIVAIATNKKEANVIAGLVIALPYGHPAIPENVECEEGKMIGMPTHITANFQIHPELAMKILLEAWGDTVGYNSAEVKKQLEEASADNGEYNDGYPKSDFLTGEDEEPEEMKPEEIKAHKPIQLQIPNFSLWTRNFLPREMWGQI